jgi:hypothetical protein
VGWVSGLFLKYKARVKVFGGDEHASLQQRGVIL